MQFLDASADRTFLGLAHGPGIVDLVKSSPGLVDYVEVAFEQLRHTPSLSSLQDAVPVLLHCASLSIAGFVPPSEDTVVQIGLEANRTGTPWIGEHLAFLSADGMRQSGEPDALPTNLTFTLCPQLSNETVERVAENLELLRSRFSVPLILENSPQYYSIPGSTMTLVDFVAEVAARCDIGLLLDLSHLMITSSNTGSDVFKEIEKFPLERVVEIHISGFSEQSGIVWDDHSSPAPEEMFMLLERVLKRVRPRAVTIEYNWSEFPQHILLSHISKTRAILAGG
jgi:uncharacterized protein (UPF0276 family)